MKEIIVINRKRLVTAKLSDLSRRIGSCIEPIKLNDGTITTVELDEDILTKALIKVFEPLVYDSVPRQDADKFIINHYQACCSHGGDRLTESGREFISALITSLAEQAFFKSANK